MTEAERDAYHAEKMKKKKEARTRMLATKTEERGLLIVHTGKGKGKSTAAFGMVFRAIGHGFKVGIVQFVKGAWGTGERDVLENYSGAGDDQGDGRRLHLGHAGPAARSRGGAGCVGGGQGDDRRPHYKMVLLDELNIVLRYEYLPLDEVLEVLRNKPRDLHVIVTGRNAKDELIEIADLVTEMTEIKHPFRSGVKAQAGDRVLDENLAPRREPSAGMA